MNYLLLTVLVAGLGMVLTEPAESDLRRAMETAATEVVRARRVVHNRVVRPAVDTIQTISATKVIDLRDTRPGSAGYGPDRRDNPYKRGKH